MILIELKAAIDAAGTVQTFYVCDAAGGYTTAPTDTPANEFFSSRIVVAGTLGVSAFSDGRTGGATKLEVGEIVLANADGGLDDWLNYSFDGRPVTIRAGEPGGAYPGDFATILQGTVESLDATFSQIVIRLRDKQFVFDKPALSARYTGGNLLPAGLEGVAGDLKGKTKPKAYGKVFNVAPPCVNTSRLIYETGVVTTVDAVYDRGVALTAGAAYASQADMEATAPAAGQFRAWPAGGYIRLGSTPAGLLTADLTQGAAAANRTAGQVLRQLAIDAGLPAGEVSAADVAALDAANPAVVGIWLEGDITTGAAMDQVAASVGAFYAFDGAGVLRLGRLSAPTGDPVATLEAWNYKRGISRRAPRDAGIPSWRVALKHSKIWNTQPTDLAGAVTAERRAYLANEYRTETATDEAVKVQWLMSDEVEVATLLTAGADASTEAARLLALYKARRDVFDVPVPLEFITANNLNLMDLVSLVCPRFGMSAGRLLRVIGKRVELGKNQAILTLWG